MTALKMELTGRCELAKHTTAHSADKLAILLAVRKKSRHTPPTRGIG